MSVDLESSVTKLTDRESTEDQLTLKNTDEEKSELTDTKLTWRDTTDEDIVEANIGEGEFVVAEETKSSQTLQAEDAEGSKDQEAPPEQEVAVNEQEEDVTDAEQETSPEEDESEDKRVSTTDETEEPVDALEEELEDLFDDADNTEEASTLKKTGSGSMSFTAMMTLFDEEKVDSEENLLRSVSQEFKKKSETGFDFEGTEVLSEHSMKSQTESESPDISIVLKGHHRDSASITESTFDPHKKQRSLDMDTIAEEDEDEEFAGEEEPEVPDILIDRQLYYRMYDVLQPEHNLKKLQNSHLQSRLVAYFTRRKMFHVLQEDKTQLSEVKNRYEKDLDQLEQVYEKSEREKQSEKEDIEHLKHKHHAQTVHLDTMFAKLQQAEVEYGNSLTIEKTGRANMDKVTDRFVKRQKSQMNVLIKLRMLYMHLKEKLRFKTQELDKLDNLGPGFRIMDFVQLKHDNRNLQDRLEEKDTELTRLRQDCQNTIQILAHNREKIKDIELATQQLVEDFHTANEEYDEAREHLSFAKRERDHVRNQIKNMRLGLLEQPKFLTDLERAVVEIKQLKIEIAALKEGCEGKSRKIEAVRRNMDAFLRKKAKDDIKRQHRESRAFSITSDIRELSDAILPLYKSSSLNLLPPIKVRRRNSVSMRQHAFF